VQKQNSICYLSENKMVRQLSWDAATQQELSGLVACMAPLPFKSWAQTRLVDGEKKANNDQTKMFLVKLK
jgi:hypothetical protein